jgi:type I restriction enzyme, S subunit
MTTRTVTLGSIAKITSGGTPQRTTPAYWNGAIPWVKTAQIQNSIITPEYVDEWITQEGLEQSSARMVPKGTILMAMYGQGKTRGQVAILGLDAAINQACAAILLDPGADRDYVYQQLRFRYESIRALSNTGSQENLNAELIREIAFPLPGIDAQSEIAQVLGAWDTAIQKTEQLIAAKERHYSHELSHLISRGQHPHAHVGAFAEEVSARNRGGQWRTVALSEIADRVQRQSDGGDYPLLTISSASGFIRQEDRYSRYMAGESAKTYTLLRAGEFSYNKGNSKRYEFGCVFQLQELDAALVPSVYVSFKLHDSVCASYMRHLFAADYLKPQLRALVKTGVRNNGLLNIRPDEFMGTKVPLPPLEHQLRIANYLDAASAEVDLLKQKLTALRPRSAG